MKYIQRSIEGISVYNEGVAYLNKGLKQYINELCMRNLSTFDGRATATQKILKSKSNIPIYVNKDIFLFPSKSIRKLDMIYINFYRVISIKKKDQLTSIVTFNDLDSLEINETYQKMIKQFKRCEYIHNYLNNYENE